jgi:hypothetical protein
MEQKDRQKNKDKTGRNNKRNGHVQGGSDMTGTVSKQVTVCPGHI